MRRLTLVALGLASSSSALGLEAVGGHYQTVGARVKLTDGTGMSFRRAR